MKDVSIPYLDQDHFLGNVSLHYLLSFLDTKTVTYDLLQISLSFVYDFENEVSLHAHLTFYLAAGQDHQALRTLNQSVKELH